MSSKEAQDGGVPATLSISLTGPAEDIRRALLEGGGKGVSLLDARGRLFRPGPGLDTLLGVSRSRLDGAPLDQLVPELAGKLPSLLREAASRGWTSRWGLTTSGGRSVALSVAPIANGCDERAHTCSTGNGEDRSIVEESVLPCSFALFVRDESTVSEPLERSVHQFALLRAVLSGSGDPVCVLDAESRIVGWNRAAERTYGYREEEVLGRSPGFLAPDRLREAGELEIVLREVRRLGTLQAYETTRVTRDGEERHVELTISRLDDSDGKCIGYSIIHRDVTEKIRLRNRSVRDEKLAAVGRTASQMAHEIRNPLGAIRLNVEMARDEVASGGDSGEALELLDQVLQEIDRLARIVNEYLQFSRLPSAHPDPLDLAEVIEEAVSLLREEMRQAGIEIAVDFPDGLPPCRCDRDQMYRVILNLLRNAIEASSSGDTVCVCGSSEPDAVRIRIADQGPGIAEHELERIFEPFHTTKPNGTGLGLPLARKIVEEHGGVIHIPRTGPDGTTFEIVMPIGREEGGS